VGISIVPCWKLHATYIFTLTLPKWLLYDLNQNMFSHIYKYLQSFLHNYVRSKTVFYLFSVQKVAVRHWVSESLLAHLNVFQRRDSWKSSLDTQCIQPMVCKSSLVFLADWKEKKLVFLVMWLPTFKVYISWPQSELTLCIVATLVQCLNVSLLAVQWRYLAQRKETPS
jgi:hypothetical protein